MPKSSCFRTLSKSQRVHGSLTLPKSPRHHFHPNFPLIKKKLSRKTYLWIRSKMLGLFVNKLMADHMYSAHGWEKIPQEVQRQSLKNKKQFLKFLLHFQNLHEVFQLRKKKINLIALIFGKLLTPKNVLPWVRESSCFRTPSKSQSLHGFLTLPKFNPHHFYPNFPLIQDKLYRITYPWIRSKMLGRFLNTLTADHIYSAHSCE